MKMQLEELFQGIEDLLTQEEWTVSKGWNLPRAVAESIGNNIGGGRVIYSKVLCSGDGEFSLYVCYGNHWLRYIVWDNKGQFTQNYLIMNDDGDKMDVFLRQLKNINEDWVQKNLLSY